MKPNEEQFDIINYFTDKRHMGRILSVEAPPGTGKTYTAVATCINYTNQRLIENSEYNGMSLILTFSKNARAQIENQLDKLCHNDKQIKKHIEITNFHSFFQKYVWAYSKYIGLDEDLIITSTKQRKKMLDEKLSFIPKYTGDKYQYDWIDSLLEGELYPLLNGKIRTSVKDILPYKDDIEKIIKDANKKGYIGFSDIGYYMNKLLTKSSELLEIIQRKYEVIVLDEYQDVSDLQDEIVKKIIGNRNKAIFFSDSKQMIYGWRGASSTRIHDLFHHYDREILSIELKKNMRFKDRKDIDSLISKVRKNEYNIEQAKTTDNVKYIKIPVDDKNLYNKRSKNIMYSKLQYAIINNLPNIINTKEKSIGVLCRNNDQVEFLQRVLREKFSIHTKIISNNEEEHNMVCDLIEFLNKPVEGVDINQLTNEVTKYIFAIIYDNNIGSIKRNKLDLVTYTNYKNARLPALRKIKEAIEIADKDRNFINCIYKSITIMKEMDFKINYCNFSLLKKALSLGSVDENKITKLFLQHQYLQAFKRLNGIYILNIHQSKGREFDFVYLVDRESISKDENLFYVGVSRTKEKLSIIDWVQK